MDPTYISLFYGSTVSRGNWHINIERYSDARVVIILQNVFIRRKQI
jgi:hypothetical protein